MFLKSSSVITALALAAAAYLPTQTAIADPPEGQGELHGAVANFRLSDQTGAVHELYNLLDAPAVVIVTQMNGDPLSREAIQALEGFKAIFSKAAYLALNSNPADSAAGIAAEAKAIGTDIPILHDAQQVVARTLGVTQTGEAFIIDPAGWKVVYRGPVNSSAAADVAAHYLLFNALVHVMGRRPVEEASVAVKGTPIRISATD